MSHSRRCLLSLHNEPKSVDPNKESDSFLPRDRAATVIPQDAVQIYRIFNPGGVAQEMHKRAIKAMRDADELHSSGQHKKAIDLYAELTLGSPRLTPIVALKANTMMAQHWSARNDAKEAKAYVKGAETAYSTCKITQGPGMPDDEAEATAIMTDMRGILDGLAGPLTKPGNDKENAARDLIASTTPGGASSNAARVAAALADADGPFGDEIDYEDELDEDDDGEHDDYDRNFDPMAVFEDEDFGLASFSEYTIAVDYLRQTLKAERAKTKGLEEQVHELTQRLEHAADVLENKAGEETSSGPDDKHSKTTALTKKGQAKPIKH